MTLARTSTGGEVPSSVVEQRRRDLLAKAQRRAAGAAERSATVQDEFSSDSEVEATEAKKPRTNPAVRIKPSPSSGSETSGDERQRVKAKLTREREQLEKERSLAQAKNKVKRPPPSSSSESESSTDGDGNRRSAAARGAPPPPLKAVKLENLSSVSKKAASKSGGQSQVDNNEEEEEENDGDVTVLSVVAAKRKRNSFLPTVVENPWKKTQPQQPQQQQQTITAPDHNSKAATANLARKQASRDETSTSDSDSNDDNEAPEKEQPHQKLQKQIQATTSPSKEKKVNKSKQSSSDSSSSSSDSETETTNVVSAADDAASATAVDAEESQKAASEKDSEFFRPLGSKKRTKKDPPLAAAVPKWVQKAVPVSAKVESHDDLAKEEEILGSKLIETLRQNGVRGLFPIQKEVIRSVLDPRTIRQGCPPRDLCVAAPTGSGKTLAFVLPLVRLLKRRNFEKAIRACILLPTAELAKQVFDVVRLYGQEANIAAALLTGLRTRADEEKTVIERGHCIVDVVVATPAKLLEHLRWTKGFSLKRLEFLVLDEADRMADMIQHGLIQDIEEAVFSGGCNSSAGGGCRCVQVFPDAAEAAEMGRQRPGALSCCTLDAHHPPLRKLLYSATLMADPEKLKNLNLYYPQVFHAGAHGTVVKSTPPQAADASKDEAKAQTSTASTTPAAAAASCNHAGAHATMLMLPERLEERCVPCDASLRPLVVWWLLRGAQNDGEGGGKRVAAGGSLVFARTREECHRLRLVLDQLGGCRVADLSAEMKKRQRQKTLQAFENGEYDVMVSTAVLSRGMDLENVRNVILYHRPQSAEEYVHAVGRTARANKEGTSVVLIAPEEQAALRKTLKVIGNSNVSLVAFSRSEVEEFFPKYEQALATAKQQLVAASGQHSQHQH